MNTKQIVALSVGVPVALIAVGSVAAYQASVHEQICLSYENQGKLELIGMEKTLTEMNSALQEISKNPFAGFAYLPLLPSWKEKGDGHVKKANDWRYAYGKTCGEARRDKFLSSPEVVGHRNRIDALNDTIQSYQF